MSKQFIVVLTESSLQRLYTFLLPYPCIMKNNTAIIRQNVEMAHPMYETICKALCSTFGISCQIKKRFSHNQAVMMFSLP